MNAVRLGNPVSWSVMASMRNCDSASTRRVRSSTRHIKELTCPSTPIKAELNHSQNTSAPSARRCVETTRLLVSSPLCKRANAALKSSDCGSWPTTAHNPCPTTSEGCIPSSSCTRLETRVTRKSASNSNTVNGLLSMCDDSRSLAARSESVATMSSCTASDDMTMPATPPSASRQGDKDTVRQMARRWRSRPTRS